jgi:hypothetical protein
MAVGHPAWPEISDIDAVSDDNAKILLERADTLLKGQDDGLKAMESRMGSLFGQAVTLASAAIAATVTAFGAAHPAQGTSTSASSAPVWALPGVWQALTALSACWLLAVIAAAWVMRGQTWTVSGVQPHELYTEQILGAPPNSVRLLISRMLQQAIDENAERTRRYSGRLGLVINLLAAGPIIAALAALSVTHPPWASLAICGVGGFGLMWLVRKLFA